MRVRRKGRVVAPLLAAMVLIAAMPTVVEAQDICQDPGNLTVNCQFDAFGEVPPYGAVASGWTPFVEFSVEPPAFNSAGETPLAPAQEIFCSWLPFTAGIYQQVQSTPGTAYVAAIGWAPYASYSETGERNEGQFIGRKVGIDPRGGIDPTSPHIVWSPEVWDQLWGVFPQLRVSAVAQEGTITVFVRAHNPQSHGNDKVWFDAVTLMVDAAQPAATPTPIPPRSTPTSPPPTATATALPPTNTPAPTNTPPPTETSMAQPTETALPTYTPPATATPSPSVTPSVIASATTDLGVNAAPAGAAPTAAVAPAPAPQRKTYDWVPTILVAVGVASFLAAGILGGVLLFLRRPQSRT